MLTEEQKRILTKEQKRILVEDVFEECWHEWDLADGRNYSWICRKCSSTTSFPTRRTFDTGNDLTDLKEALEKKGLWLKFYKYVCKNYAFDWHDKLVDWLIDKDRFPKLVAEFMEVKK